MGTSWRFEVDWERNGNFSGTYDDITEQVIKAYWFLGFRKAYESVADNSRIILTLRNTDKRFSPENGASPLAGFLQPHTPARVVSDDGVTERVMWVGRLDAILPMTNQHGQRTVELTATGSMRQMNNTETSLTLKEEARTDEILRPLILEAVIPPTKANVWILGKSRLGVDTVLARESDIMELETGLITLTLAGDNWVQGDSTNTERKNFSVYRAIQDVVEAERGRFFFNRAGKAIFWNRDHLLTAQTVAATFSDTMQEMQYAYGGTEDFHNEIVVVCRPRSISPTSDEILWELDEPVSIPPGQTRTIRAQFEDESGARIGGRDTSLEYTFSSGSGTVSLEAKANQATLTVSNTGSGTAILETCIVKGQKIVDAGRMEAVAKDQNKITQYGRRVLRVNLTALSVLEEAQAIADLELTRRQDPQGTVQSITVKSHALEGGEHHANQLSLTIGDLIQIEESQTAHSASYWVIGEAHRLLEGLYETQWYLEPANVLFLAQYDARYQDGVVALKETTSAYNQLGQGFQPLIDGEVKSVRLWLKKTGSHSGDLTAKIYSDYSTPNPWRLGTVGKSELGTSTLLATDGTVPGSAITNGTSQTVAASSLGTTFAWVTFTFATPPSVEAETTYWVVLESSDSLSPSDYVEWGTDTTDQGYAEGEMKVYKASWKKNGQGSCFQVVAA